jgi:hypothetical protein
MATQSTTRGNPVVAAAALMALGAVMAGCQTSYGPMMYAGEAHAQRVEAWCYHNLTGHRTESIIRQCVDQVWINVPLGECDIDPCADTGRFHPPYAERRGYK